MGLNGKQMLRRTEGLDKVGGLTRWLVKFSQV